MSYPWILPPYLAMKVGQYKLLIFLIQDYLSYLSYLLEEIEK